MKKLLIIISLIIFPSLVFAQTFDRNLYYGLRNDPVVQQLQEFLTDQGIYSGPITGNFFSLTLTAVKKFQTQNGINPAAGFFGPLTRAKVNDILAAQLNASNQQAIQETGTTTPAISQNAQSNNTQQLIQNLQAQILSLQNQIISQQNQTTPAQPTTPTQQVTNQPAPTQPTAQTQPQNTQPAQQVPAQQLAPAQEFLDATNITVDDGVYDKILNPTSQIPYFGIVASTTYIGNYVHFYTDLSKTRLKNNSTSGLSWGPTNTVIDFNDSIATINPLYGTPLKFNFSWSCAPQVALTTARFGSYSPGIYTYLPNTSYSCTLNASGNGTTGSKTFTFHTPSQSQ